MLGDGRTVTRQTAENMHAKERGYTSDYERRQAFKESKAHGGYERDADRARGQGISTREFNERRAALYADYKRNDNNWRGIDKSPNGPLAKYLVAMGRRSESADYAVGDSPKA
jgi:hypothetical protein